MKNPLSFNMTAAKQRFAVKQMVQLVRYAIQHSTKVNRDWTRTYIQGLCNGAMTCLDFHYGDWVKRLNPVLRDVRGLKPLF